MIITRAENSGFCPGVKRADKSIKELIAQSNGKIYTLGALIHNRIYNDSLSARGVTSISIGEIEPTLKELNGEKATLVIRTHGITKEDFDYLSLLETENENFSVVDMTCSYVKRIHRIAEENTDEDSVFLLYCDKNHPEAKGIISYAKGEKYMFSSIDEIKNLNFGDKKIVLCSQTTQNNFEYKKILNFFKKLYTNLFFFDTICNVTQKRQDEAIELAKKSDAMIVVGGRDSSNTKKLYDLCRINSPYAVHIESVSELPLADFPSGAQKIGITAGASTPDDIILEVIKQWKKN